ncbi:YqaJ viral recombinase family protein [Mangrovibacillus cuniculi]|uniref:YqaJ viral recombinase domain-containing protein n=1 Tax=Mangrovibacillus cuniculi TaxID=2593652 RepID=A0A7S8HFP6_9BACI|nr:YqaJ viral recombinase family protein [Mangrovibacillus cuniculi]QPC47134.1 hypothetical protein G8O30_09225 [Mangrovibacillus cuniculi]QPC48515.1 hypothetical protein G8O30_16040 [Mangrovibacillus cuniculi]
MSAITLYSTVNMTREQWLQARTEGIGGSDSSIILGINKWKTPFELWLEKTGQVLPAEIENDVIYFGNVLEDLVAEEFTRRSGKKVRKKNAILQHPEHSFMLANVDGVIVGEKAVLECKTTSAYNAKEWEDDEIPAAYLIQIQHYLAVLGPEYEKAYIAVLIGGQKFVWKEIARDEELITIITNEEKYFWEHHVLANNPPKLDGSSAAEKYIKEKYDRAAEGKVIDLGTDDKQAIDDYLHLKESIDALQKQMKEYENQIKLSLGDAELGQVQDKLVTWKNVVSNRVDSKQLKANYPDIYKAVTKESYSRRFTIKDIG